jgi:hypothetical protein
MPFIITATTEQGAASFQRDTPLSAHEKAVELQRRGERDVLISSPDGQLYAPADFDRLFVQDPDIDAPQP